MIRGKTSGRTRAAMIQLLGARAVSIAATAIGFAILARLLSPSTFGYFAIIVASYGVLNVLVEFGLRQFLIRAEYEIDVGAIRSATRLSLVIAVCACGLCIAADALPTTLLVEDVQDAMKPMGLALLVSPLVLGREAQLQRSLRFKALAGSAVARTIADVLVATSMAAAGFGVMALASAFLAGRIVEAALIFAFGRPDTGNTATGARPPCDGTSPLVAG